MTLDPRGPTFSGLTPKDLLNLLTKQPSGIVGDVKPSLGDPFGEQPIGSFTMVSDSQPPSHIGGCLQQFHRQWDFVTSDAWIR